MYRDRLIHTQVNTPSGEKLRNALLAYHDFRRSPEKPSAGHLQAVARWQSDRLKNTHKDLYQIPAYRPGLDFLLNELYAPGDFYQRDDDIDRIFPKLVRLLPDHILDIVSNLVELNHLTQSMDQRLARHLFEDMGITEIDTDSYLVAYPKTSTRKERLHQIQLIANIGDDLEKYTQSRFLMMSLKMTRKPAEMAGLKALHDFLMNGFAAFNTMGSVGYLLDKIVTREVRILEAIFDGNPRAFEVV